MAVWPVPQAVGVAPRNSTSLGSRYVLPWALNCARHTSSVSARTVETKAAILSSAGGRCAGPCATGAGSEPPPLRTPSSVNGLMPSAHPATSAITMVPRPMPRPPPKLKPPPPIVGPSSRRSSTLSLSRLPSHFIAGSLSGWTAIVHETASGVTGVTFDPARAPVDPLQPGQGPGLPLVAADDAALRAWCSLAEHRGAELN